MKKRLQNILAHRGVASRRRSGELISSGKVQVDGKTITEKGRKFDPEVNQITVEGRQLPSDKRRRYFIAYKPEGVISTAKDTHGRSIVTDMLPDDAGRLYPAGRLDKDTVGLVLLTNDGRLANQVMHPSIKLDKEYVAEVEPALKRSAHEVFRKGIKIGPFRTAPCRISLICEEAGRGVYRVLLHEGRKRQIRRMFAKLGSEVVTLKRTRIGTLTLEGMRKGSVRELSSDEIDKFKAQIKKGLKHGTG